MRNLLALLSMSLLTLQPLGAWGMRGHTVANLAAVEGIPQDGPAFLKAHEAYVGHLGTIPDTWRSFTEPYLRISEDANHGWYTEGFDFIPNPPHSRTEFILRVYDRIPQGEIGRSGTGQAAQYPLYRHAGVLDYGRV